MSTIKGLAKRIHFIRHGESLYNRLCAELRLHALPQEKRPVILDPGLTHEGVAQAKRLKEYLSTLRPKIAISSPYTRALQTCLLSYGSDNVIITDLCGEIMAASSDDIGLPASCLKVAFPMFDFSSLNETWWYTQDGIKSQTKAVNLITEGKLLMEPEDHVEARVDRFYDFLSKMSEQNIAVFAHNEFLVTFLSKYFGFNEEYLDNCEVFSVNMETS